MSGARTAASALCYHIHHCLIAAADFVAGYTIFFSHVTMPHTEGTKKTLKNVSFEGK